MTPDDRSALLQFLPAEKVGDVLAIAPIRTGLSGSSVFAVTTNQGECVLRLQHDEPFGAWLEHQRVHERAAAAGIAPAILHVDLEARAVVSERVVGPPIPAIAGHPAMRARLFGSLVEQLRRLHSLPHDDVSAADPLALAVKVAAEQRARPGFPDWARDDGAFVHAGEVLARDPRPPALSHNDMNPGNLLWDGERVWIVDWSSAAMVHPLYDLAALAMFMRMPDDEAHGLVARLLGEPPDDTAKASFAALRRVAALFCGHVFLSLVPDLNDLSEPVPLATFYQRLGAGKLDLQSPDGQGAFGQALLLTGLEARTVV